MDSPTRGGTLGTGDLLGPGLSYLEDHGAVGPRAPSQQRMAQHVVTEGKAQEASRILCMLLQHALDCLQLQDSVALQALNPCVE